MADQEAKVIGIVDFTVISSAPVKILLDDGTRINIQIVPVRLSKTDQKLPDGQPMYHFQCQQIIDQIAPEGKILPTALKKEV